MNDRRSPSLEDLLRLKRLERPDPQFWEQFERELRSKQLAALVARRPWWRSLPQFVTAFSRHRLALASGAAAVAAAGIGYHVFLSSPSSASASLAVAYEAPIPAAASPAAMAVKKGPSVRRVAVALAVPAHRAVRAQGMAPEAPADPTLPLITMPDELPEGLASDRFGSLGRAPAVNLAAAEAAMTEIGRDLSSQGQAFDSRLVAARSQVSEPLAQLPSPAEERRQRLRDAEVFSAVAGTPVAATPASERLVSGLDERLAGSESRYNLTSERDDIGLSIRF